MTTENKSGWSNILEKLEHERNRSHIVKPSGGNEFSIAFRDIRHVIGQDFEASSITAKTDFCVVEFLISRGEQQILFPVYIKREEVDPMDYVREAAHRMHMDLVRLCEQTANLKLRDQGSGD
ncbi:hypothetical protein [Methylobacterium sp. JK268]